MDGGDAGIDEPPTLLAKLPCRESVRALDGGTPWTRPTGLRFLNGKAPKLPEALAKKVTPY